MTYFQEEVWEVGSQLIGLSIGVLIMVYRLFKFYLLFILNSLSGRQPYRSVLLLHQRRHMPLFFLSIYSCCLIPGYIRCKVIILNSYSNMAEYSSSTSLAALSVPISSQVPHSKVLDSNCVLLDEMKQFM